MGAMMIPSDDANACSSCGIGTKGHYIKVDGKRLCLSCVAETGVDYNVE